MRCYSPATTFLISSVKLCTLKGQGTATSSSLYYIGFLESTLKILWQLVCDKVVQEQKYLGNNLVHIVMITKSSTSFLMVLTPVSCNNDPCAFSIEVVQKYLYD